MKLTTILTSGYPLHEIAHRLSEWAWRKAAHALPRRLAYWSFIDTSVRHLPPDAVVPEVPFGELLRRVPMR